MEFKPSGTEGEKQARITAQHLAEENRRLELENLYTNDERIKEKEKHEIEPLTGLKRREIFERALEDALQESRKEVSIIMIDLDRFKSINDTYGHPVGDEVLRRVSQVLRESVRVSDIATIGREEGEEEAQESAQDHDTAARYGGEELIVLLPGASADVASSHAEDIRGKIEKLKFDGYPDLHVTASFGVASSATAHEASSLLKQADEAVYAAKNGGRNRVIRYYPVATA